jgi:3-oxoadipate enol-lactonase
MFIFADHFRLEFQVEGARSGVPLVFINSLGCDLRIWEPVLPAFAERFRVIRYDKRGHGRSDVPPGPYTIRDHSEDLAALFETLDISGAVLVGISVGGLIAMDFALQHPERVRALALADTGPVIGTSESWNERIQAVQEGGMAGMAESIVSRWFRPSFISSHPSEYHRYLEMLRDASPDGYVATCAALRDADLRSRISGIAAPALALCGAQDPVITPEQTRAWAACLPDARVVVIPDAAHLPCIEQPAAFAGAIDRFLLEECHV